MSTTLDEAATTIARANRLTDKDLANVFTGKKEEEAEYARMIDGVDVTPHHLSPLVNPSPQPPIKLTRIGPITLSQQNFTLGKHSSQTYLTLSTPDAFGDMRAEIIDLRSWLLSDGIDEAVNKAQSLLDQLGTHMQSVVSSRSLKGGS